MKSNHFFPSVVGVALLSMPLAQLLAAPGTVQSHALIASGTGGSGAPTLADNDLFGRSCALLGDLDGDGVPEIAVGANGDATGGGQRGAVHILFLNADGTVKSSTKIASGTGGPGAPTLANSELFGSSCASLGDLDGDGVSDLVVGAYGDFTGGSQRGAVHVLFLNTDGTVKANTKIASGLGGPGAPTLANSDRFGHSCVSLGDLDGDGVPELAVGADGDATGGSQRGAVHVLFLNTDGTVKASSKIASGTGGPGAPTLADNDKFGHSCVSLGDLDGDGVPELAVGADGDATGGGVRGAVHVLFLNADGTVKANTKIASGTGGPGAPTLADGDQFGISCVSLGDLDGDGVPELGVGAFRDDTGGDGRGAVHVLFLNGDGTVKANTKIASGLGGPGAPTLTNNDRLGISLAPLGDLDGDGLPEIAVGANGDDTGGNQRGAVYVLEMGDPPLMVTTVTDEFDTPSDDAGSTGLSLREAIRDADATGEFRTIWFAPPLDGQTITLGGSFLNIMDQSVSISGEGLSNGLTISGNDQSQIFLMDETSTLNLSCLTLTGGLAGDGTDMNGGAIQNSSGVLTIESCYLAENQAELRGGAIYNEGILRVDSSTFSSNSAALAGGSIYSRTDSVSAISHITNSTFYGNQASTAGGGALYTSGGSMTQTTVRHCTILGNEAIGTEGGGVRANAMSEVTVINSIITGNIGTADVDLAATSGGVINQEGVNLVGLEANLAPLGNYGGKTPTMAPLSSSLALDAGAYFPLPDTDQRGVAKSDGMPDLGAVEGAYIPPVVDAAIGLPDNSAAKAGLSKKIKKLKKKAKASKRKGQVAKAKKFKAKIKKLTQQLRAL